nr:protein FAR1-RELATED SEQUENCE 1-like [Lolium perenne]
MAKNEPLRLEFNATIDYSMTVEEFETRWAEMILKHNVADNTHLQDIYDMRASFVPAYFKDRFFPFLQTTARSEGFNAVLKRYVTPHHDLSHFFEQYMKSQEKIDVAKIQMNSRRKTRSSDFGESGLWKSMLSMFPVAGSVFGYGKRTYRVEANSEEGIYICECSKINRDGLLCCHALRVMAQLGAVNEIPAHYILPRWTVPPDDIIPEKVELPPMPTDRKLSNKERKLLRYGTLCNNWTDYAKIAAESEKATALAEKYMRELGKELAAMKISAAAKRKDKKQPSKNDGVTPETEIGGDGGQGSSTQYEHVRDPILTTTKGRPEEKRKKSGLHLKASKPQKCRGCGSAQHSTSECPSKITPAPQRKEFDFFRDMV